ncbi:GNAT family N-acetyltransferase [uncultured Paludibaculum sp.]|uniref:GNAT family N-acetyltransferase n=1 Tax=uncultured Paludibaculum sp. TaxID=1765020 RepID=UPI002AAA9B26|nr:GNAT family N-acetyltransferase [uncultured Paludibaculum sp.]
MPPILERTAIRARLHRDAPWAAYALGDLAEGYFQHSSWLQSGDATALLYREFPTPILWMQGAGDDLAQLVAELPPEPEYILQIQPAAVPLLERRYRMQSLKPMWRMSLDLRDFRPAASDGAVRLTPADLQALLDLYADGEAAHEGPDFFFPSMLEQAVFIGGWADGELAAVAGTHLVSTADRVAAIGNVYTRRSRRGQGWATRLTTALVQELLRQGMETIVLSVHQANHTAERVYQRLGFQRHCDFFEGRATLQVKHAHS